MAIKQAALGAKWATVTDVLDRLSKARDIRAAQKRSLENFQLRVDRRRQELETSLCDLPTNERSGVIGRALASYRAELRRGTASERGALLIEANGHKVATKGVAVHYRSTVQMLMRESLGSERRSRIQQQIEGSGPTEIAALAEFAASTKDKELAAALCARNGATRADERPFSSHELADVLCGQDYRKVAAAIMEIERLADEVAHEDAVFAGAKRGSAEAIRLALVRQDEQAIGADLSELDESAEGTRS